MASKQEVKTYKIDLDASNLIKSYYTAIAEMKKAGMKTSIVDGLIKDLEKLEKQSNELGDLGKFGVQGSKGLINFEKQARKLYTSLAALSNEMQRLTSYQGNFSRSNLDPMRQSINRLTTEISHAYDDVRLKLKEINVPFNITDKVGKSVKSTDELIKRLEEELDLRKRNIELQEKAIEQERQKVILNASRKNTQFLTQSEVATVTQIKGKGLNSNYNTGTRRNTIEEINRVISSGILNREKVSQVIKQIDEIAEEAVGSSADFFKNVEVFYSALTDLYNRTQAEIERVDKKELKKAQQHYSEIGNVDPKSQQMFSPDIEDIIKRSQSAEVRFTSLTQQRAKEEKKLNDLILEQDNAQRTLSNSLSNFNGKAEDAADSLSKYIAEMVEGAEKTESLETSIEDVGKRMLQVFSVPAILAATKGVVKETFNSVQQLDASFASIAMVTDKSLNDMWSTYADYAQLAQQMGQQTDSVIKASALFYQQGLTEAEALKLTTDTMKLATLAGNSYEMATQEMTSAIRGFKMEMSEGTHVTDVYSTLAASAAASVDDIAQAMARTASIANSAGLSFENTSAFLTQMIETTQESAENIGTSLKTIIARFTELKENVAGTVDSEFDDLDYNKVDKALKSVGVSLIDTKGQFRDLDDVFLELSQKWNTLDRNTQRY